MACGDNHRVRCPLPVLLFLFGCAPESTFPSTTGSINTDWSDGDDEPNPGDSGDDEDDDDGGDGGNSGGDGGGSSSGGDLYVQSCVNCHGQDGEGTDSGPVLSGEVSTLTDSELTDILLNGTGDMPDPGLSESEVDTLVDWLRNAWQ
ncbi:MAG: cytochrome c551 [Myxococcota bacterium]